MLWKVFTLPSKKACLQIPKIQYFCLDVLEQVFQVIETLLESFCGGNENFGIKCKGLSEKVEDCPPPYRGKRRVNISFRCNCLTPLILQSRSSFKAAFWYQRIREATEDPWDAGMGTAMDPLKWEMGGRWKVAAIDEKRPVILREKIWGWGNLWPSICCWLFLSSTYTNQNYWMLQLTNHRFLL